MTIGELILILNEFPDDLPVVIESHDYGYPRFEPSVHVAEELTAFQRFAVIYS
jgi:hypothetical protein